MTTKACAACGKEVEEAFLFLSDRGEICGDCEVDEETASHEALRAGLAHPAVIIGLIAGIVPFFISISETNTTTVNGETLTSSSLDFAAVAGGGLAALAGIAFFAIATRANLGKGKQMAAALVILALGVVHLLRGFGLITL